MKNTYIFWYFFLKALRSENHFPSRLVQMPATATATAIATATTTAYATATFVEMSQYFWLDGRKDLPTTAMIRSQLNFSQTNNFQVILNTKLK